MNTQTLQILIVDDEQIVHDTLSAFVLELGHQVHNAYDGVTALEAIGQTAFDLALFDVRMPGMDGLALLAETRKIRPDLPAIILTGHGNPAMADKAKKLGALAFLAKPIHLMDFIQILDALTSSPDTDSIRNPSTKTSL